jgi:hypothetical protein
LKDSNVKIVENFNSNVDAVISLSEFDNVIMQFAIDGLGKVVDSQKKIKNVHPNLIPENTLTALNSIRENGSFRPKYQEMFNQCVILLVSYFSSSLSELFISNIKDFLPYLENQKMLGEKLDVSLKDIQEIGFDLTDYIGDILKRKKDISFQDMKSICRSFENYLMLKLKEIK